MDSFFDAIPVAPEWKAHAVALMPIIALALAIVITKLSEQKQPQE